jgi:hypothetical protein
MVRYLFDWWKLRIFTNATMSSSSTTRFKKQKQEHICCQVCSMTLPEDGTIEACAIKHLLANVGDLLPMFVAKGTQANCMIAPAKAVWQTLIHPHHNECGSTCGCSVGLTKASVAVLSPDLSTHCFKAAAVKRAQMTPEESKIMLSSPDIGIRKDRCDKYPKLDVYHFFHGEGEGNLPDYSMKVEPDKSKRAHWKGKSWQGPDGTMMNLTCQRRVRRGLLKTLAEEYLASETHARFDIAVLLLLASVSQHCFFFFMLLLLLL